MGTAEQNIINQCANSGEELPEEIANRPQLLFGLSFYIKAFDDLDTERSHSMGVTQIPWSKIVNYAHIEGMDKQETQDFVYIIRKVDDALCIYLDSQNGNSSGPESTDKQN